MSLRVECAVGSARPVAAEVAAIEALFARGAIATVVGEPRPVLMGDMEWCDDGSLLMFAAFGDAVADAVLLRFDDVIINERGSVTFLHRGYLAGAMHRIEDADVDDPEDYRTAWRLWQDFAPLHRPLIERCYEALQALRG